MNEKLCATCRARPAVKYVLSDNMRKRIWKCQPCIDRRNVSFIVAAKERDKIKRSYAR